MGVVNVCAQELRDLACGDTNEITDQRVFEDLSSGLRFEHSFLANSFRPIESADSSGDKLSPDEHYDVLLEYLLGFQENQLSLLKIG